jgi:hypothetical protein
VTYPLPKGKRERALSRGTVGRLVTTGCMGVE